jgi:hypothetical protein
MLKSIMKIILLIPLFIISSLYAGSIKGTILAKGKIPKGVLYIFAKKFDGSMPMPLAVKRIANPKFPVKFELSEKDQMMKGMPFKGPFKITARISPNGSATDKSGMEKSTTKKVEIGDSGIQITLK